MKRKVITIALLSIMITLALFGSVGSALADEITLYLTSYQSEEITQEEIDFALSNLRYKLEEEELPKLIRVEEVYDFNSVPLYSLYEFDGYYMINIRNTGSVLERGEGNSPYYGNKDYDKYYGGYGEYYICYEGEYKNLCTGEVANKSNISQMQSRMEQLRELDYKDYLEAMTTPMPLGAENRNNISKLGKNISSLIEYLYSDADHLYNYFAKEINIDYQLKNKHNEIASQTFNKVLYTKSGSREENYGTIYFRHFGGKLGNSGYDIGYDLVYPQNLYNSCSIVAMTILLQYYYRIEINLSLLEPIEPDILDGTAIIMHSPLDSPAEIIRSKLAKYVNVLSTGSSSTDGAATYVNIDAGFDRYFKAYNIEAESIHFTSYTNIKDAIDGGHPSIMTIGAGIGYDSDGFSEDVSRHNVVVYGYTTNSLGVMDEFVCHAGLHKQFEHTLEGNKLSAECAKLFINKFYAAGNVHLSY